MTSLSDIDLKEYTYILRGEPGNNLCQVQNANEIIKKIFALNYKLIYNSNLKLKP